MVQEHASQVLPVAVRVASSGTKSYNQVSYVLMSGVCGYLLPEIVVGLVLLQLQSPQLMCDCDCVPLLRGLVGALDRLNRLAPASLKEEEEDLAWPGVKSKSLFVTDFHLENTRLALGPQICDKQSLHILSM